MKVNSIGEIGNRVTPTIDIKYYNASFEEIDEENCYKFEMRKPIAINSSIYRGAPYICHGFYLETIDQFTYAQKEKGIVREMDRQYIINSISRMEDNRKFKIEPLSALLDNTDA